ncbi:MAG: hypothetical protein ACKPKO_29600, partial [Candidatus Fonsibacter sp.]
KHVKGQGWNVKGHIEDAECAVVKEWHGFFLPQKMMTKDLRGADSAFQLQYGRTEWSMPVKGQE